MTEWEAVLRAFAWVAQAEPEEFEIRGPQVRIGPSIRVGGITCAPVEIT